MAVSENPTEDEIAACLRRSALLYAENYHDQETAEWFADWYATTQPTLDFYLAFKEFDTWRASVARRLYGGGE